MEWVQTLTTGLMDHSYAMKRNAECAKSTFPVDTEAAVTILIMISETNHIKCLGLIIGENEPGKTYKFCIKNFLLVFLRVEI